MQITPEQMQQKFETLPEGLKWAIMGANVDDHIIDIGQAEGLNVEQMGQLSLETHLVMLGFIPPKKFEESLEKSLGFPKEKIKTLANAVNEKILKNIRTHMQEAFEKKSETPSIPEHPNPSLSPIVLEGEGGNGFETREEILAALEKPELIKSPGPKPPIFSQKLSAPVQIPAVETIHSENDVDKFAPKNLPATSPKPATPKKYGVDPYREIPE